MGSDDRAVKNAISFSVFSLFFSLRDRMTALSYGPDLYESNKYLLKKVRPVAYRSNA